MDAEKTLHMIRTMVRAWEEATTPDAEHAAARELTSAIGAMDDWLTHGGAPPADWMSFQSLRVLEMVREFLQECARAMAQEESIPRGAARRVLHRLAYGDPSEPALLEDGEPEQVPEGLGLWHMMNETPVGPGPEVPIFGADFREVTLDTVTDSSYPLTSTCVCGTEVRFDLGGSWTHTTRLLSGRETDMAYRGRHRFLHLIVCDRCGIKEPWERRQVIFDHVGTCSLGTANGTNRPTEA